MLYLDVLAKVFTIIIGGIEIVKVVNEYYDGFLDDDERERIEPILKDIGLTLEDIAQVETEEELREKVESKMYELDDLKRDNVVRKLRKILDKDEYFEFE